MRKKLYACLTLICSIALLGSCGNVAQSTTTPISTTTTTTTSATTTTSTTTTPAATTSGSTTTINQDYAEPPEALTEYNSELYEYALKLDDMLPEVEKLDLVAGKGGDDPDYKSVLNDELHDNIAPNIIYYVMEEEQYDQWIETFITDKKIRKFSEYPSYYSFMKHFNLTYDDIREPAEFLYEFHREYGEEFAISEAEWDLIINGSEYDVAKHFVRDTAIITKDCYAFPACVLTEELSIADYVTYEINPYELEAKIKVYDRVYDKTKRSYEKLENKIRAYVKLCDDLTAAKNSGEDFEIDSWIDENSEFFNLS